MAIVKMKKVTVVAMAEDKQTILDDLMWLSAVDVSPLSEKLEDENLAPLVTADNVAENVDSINGKISLLSQALKTYRQYSKEKRSFFTPYQVLNRSDFEAFPAKEEKLLTNANNAIRASAELNSIKSEENRLDSLLQRLLPWKTLPFRLNEPISDKADYFFGSVPIKADISSVTEGIVDEEPPHGPVSSQKTRCIHTIS